ncbi:hypothetical protein D3C79_863410 [compost metagenome]
MQQLPGVTIHRLALLLQLQAAPPGPAQQAEQRQVGQRQQQRQPRRDGEQAEDHHRRRDQRGYQGRQQVRRDTHAIEHRPANQVLKMTLPAQRQPWQMRQQTRHQPRRQPRPGQVTATLGDVADQGVQQRQAEQ